MKNENHNSDFLIPFIVCVIALLLLVIYWAMIYIFLKDWSARSNFGESFGMLEALFSAFTFAGLVFTIYLQRKEIMTQQTELNRTAEIQKDTVKILALSAELSALNALLDKASRDLNRIDEDEKDKEKTINDTIKDLTTKVNNCMIEMQAIKMSNSTTNQPYMTT
jgi:hypothetical protein